MVEAKDNRTPYSEFLANIDPYKDLWTSLTLRFSAVWQDEAWRNLFSRAELGWDSPQVVSLHLQTNSKLLKAGTLRFPLKEGLRWLKGIEKNALRVRTLDLQLGHINRRQGTSTSNTLVRYSWQNWKLDRSGSLRMMADRNPEWEHGFELMGSGDPASTLLEPTDWGSIHDILLTSQRPYAGIGEFTTSYLGFREAKTLNYPVGFEVVALFGALFDTWTLEDGSFRGGVFRPPGLSSRDLRVAGILSRAGTIDRIHLTLGNPESVPGSKLLRSTFCLPFKGYRLLDLHLLLRGHDVDGRQLLFPSPDTTNPRMSVFGKLDRIPPQLVETLEEPMKVKSPGAFELVTSWVLHLCGFQVMLSDIPPLRGGEVPDIVAFDPYSDEGLVVEVTGKEPFNNDKLAKVARRTSELNEATPGVRLHALLVTPASDTFLPTEAAAAQELGVSLLTRNDLKGLFTLSVQNPLATDTLREILKPPNERRF